MIRKSAAGALGLGLVGLIVVLLLFSVTTLRAAFSAAPYLCLALSFALVLSVIVLVYLYRLQSTVRQLRANALRSLERNIQVMAAVSDVVFRADFEGRLIYANRAWHDMTGMDVERARGQSIVRGVHRDDQSLLADYLQRVRDGHHGSLEVELRLLNRSGRYHWHHLTARPYTTVESGEVIIGTLRDIQSQQEQSIIQTARMNVLDGLLGRANVTALATELVLAWEQLQQGQRASILVIDPGSGCLNTLAAPSMPERYSQALDGLMPGEGVGSCGTATFRGEPVYVRDVSNDPAWQDHADLARLGNVQACWSTPFFDQDGNVLGTFAVYVEQQRLPDAKDLELLGEFTRLAALVVQKSRLAQEHDIIEKRFSAIFQHAAVGIMLISPDGRFISANPCYFERSGFTEEQIKTLHPNDMLWPEDVAAVEAGLRSLRHGLVEQFTLEARYVRSDRSFSWMSLIVTLVRDAEGAALYYVFITEDISERKAQEQSLKEAAAVFESSREGMLVMDSDFRMIKANPAFAAITGMSAEEVIGRRPQVYGRNMEARAFTDYLFSKLSDDGYWQGEVLIDRHDEQDVPIWVTATAVKDDDSQGRRYMVMFSDLSGQQRSQEQLQHMAHFDSLTGLANRTLAMLKLDQGMQRASVQHAELAVLYIDLDRFKAINDGLGHAVGDEVLRQAGRRLAACCVEGDMLARLSGDEFLMIVHGRHPDAVSALGQRICASLRAPIQLDDGREIYIGASVGFACYPQDGDTAADLVRNADAAMDTAKSTGRDQVCGYTRAMTDEASQRFELERGLRKALENGEFELHYQPLIQVRSRRAFGVEALLRWRHPERGLVGPDRFIPLAEQNGLIVQIGSWVLHEACRQAREWQQQGLGLELLAVNLSPRQFIQQDVVALVRSALEESGLPANMLELEITESALMTHAQQGEETLLELKKVGVTLTIDDFGTGYSSLAYLRRFPLDKLKIDKSFLAGVPQSAGDNQLVTTILDMASNLRLDVVAEGVETEAQWRFLQGRGCDACQGFLFSPALPASELPGWLERQ